MFKWFSDWIARKAARIVMRKIGAERKAPRGPVNLPDTPRTGEQTMRKLLQRVNESHRHTFTDGTEVHAMDASDGSVPENKTAFSMGGANIPEGILRYFGSKTFMGHWFMPILAQDWMIHKACFVPARDAVRHWFQIRSVDGDDLKGNDVVKLVNRFDRKYKLRKHTIDFIGKGRMFGVRIAFRKFSGVGPEFYEQPFNLDSIQPGSYKGLVQVDPMWCMPELNRKSSSEPDSQNFYEPTYWTINNKRYHRSHLIIYRHNPPADLLKPMYMYGGIPLPQMILEAVYNASRSSNELPELLMTKRLSILSLDVVSAMASGENFNEAMEKASYYRNNYGVWIQDSDSSFQQFDTALGDVDSVSMSLYQVAAGAAGMPVTKLLGTSPKGFNATGEYDESVYHEDLESIQSNDIEALIDAHHEAVMRSDVWPILKKRGYTGELEDVSISWNPLDSPTGKEYAEIQYIKAQTGNQLVQSGAIDAYDERDRVISDPDSDYVGMPEAQRPDQDENDPLGQGGVQPGIVGAKVVEAQAKQEAAQKGDGTATDAIDCPLITNQSFLDPDIVARKVEIGDFTVQVTPPLYDAVSKAYYRLVLDGHHSLAAAKLAGVPPILEETSPLVGDYGVVAQPALMQ